MFEPIRTRPGETTVSAAPWPATSPLRLLLIEDDPADAYLIQALVEEAGVATEWRHAKGVKTIDYQTIDAWADCALVDLSLPDCQGLEAVKTFVANAPRVPVVVVSGIGNRPLALSAIYAGADDYLDKGRINAELLATTIRYAIEQRLIEYPFHQARQAPRPAPSPFGPLRPGEAVYSPLAGPLSPALEWGISLAVESAADLATPPHLRPVLGRVAENARASRGGSRLTITVDEFRPATDSGLSQGICARLTVSGTSGQTPDDAIDQTVEPEVLGDALDDAVGLAILYAVLPRAGGEPEPVPPPLVHTAVSMNLRALDPPMEGSTPSSGPRRGEHRMILVVDDEPVVRTMVTRILEQGGYSVITAASGEAALEAVQHHPGEIDLLLADVIMPKMLGTELALRMTNTHPAIPVVLMSGQSRHDLQSQGKLDTDHALIEKPFEFHELLAAVGEVIGGAAPTHPQANH